MNPALACEKRVRRHPDPMALVRLPDGELTGPRQEIVKEALKRMGCRVRIVELPWARALHDLASGDLDILPGAHKLQEREAYAHFSASDWPSRNSLYMRSQDLQRQGLADFQDFRTRQLRLGLQVGVSYGAGLDAALQDPALAGRVLRVPHRQGLWQMLAKGRVDGVLADELTASNEIRKLGLADQLQASGVFLMAEPSYTAFSRKTIDSDFVARFDAQITQMRKDGSQQAIERRFTRLIAEGLKPTAPASALRPGPAASPASR